MTAFNSKWKYEKSAFVVRVSQTTQNFVISRRCFPEDDKEIYKNLYNARAQLLLYSLNLLFGDVLAAVVVVVCVRWPDTVFARALADAIQRAHKDCKNKLAVDTAIILFAQCPLYLCYFLRN